MHKTTNRLLISAAAIAILGFQLTVSSCNSELTSISTVETSQIPVTFSGRVLSTRVIGNNWEDKDPIGIFMIKTDEIFSSLSIIENAGNKKYVFSEENQSIVPATEQDTIYYPAKDKVDFIAYYPYTTKLVNFTIPIYVGNQNIQSNIDLLYSNNLKNISLTTEKQKLSFEHKLTKLKLIIKRGNGITAEQMQGATITIENIPAKGSFSLTSAALTLDNSSSTTISFKTDANGENAEAIFLPCSCLNKNIYLTTRSGVQRIYIIKEENWSEKTEYQYTLNVEKQIEPIEIEAEISPWSDGGNFSLEQNGKEENASIWDGNSYDTSWYNPDENSFTLKNAAEFAGLARLVNINLVSFKNKTICLQNNLNLSEFDWTPIASTGSTSLFEGTFDGNHHTISGLTFSEQNSDIACGLFAQNNGTIQNLSVNGSFSINHTSTKTSAIYGSIVGINYGDIINCKNYVNITSNNTDKPFTMLAIGGICGRNISSKIIRNCQNYGEINYSTNEMSKGSPLYLGGITAFNQGNTIDCDNNNHISASGGRTQAGGIAGFCGGGAIIENCTNSGNIQVTSNADSCFVGGIVGSANSTTSNCIIKLSNNSAAITATSPTFAGFSGGIIGYMKSFVIVENSINKIHASVSANTFSGGIVGYLTENANNTVYLNCDNNGSPLKWIGNIFGKTNNSGAEKE